MQERAASGKTVEQLNKEGAGLDELRRCGFSYKEVFDTGMYTPEQIAAAGFSALTVE